MPRTIIVKTVVLRDSLCSLKVLRKYVKKLPTHKHGKYLAKSDVLGLIEMVMSDLDKVNGR